MLEASGVYVTVRKRKSKALLRHLFLCNTTHPGMGPANPVSLLFKWATFCLFSTRFFDTNTSWRAGAAHLDATMHRVLLLTSQVPCGCYYGSQSPRIGGFNELFVLCFMCEWNLCRLNWSSNSLFLVSVDLRIVVPVHSSWFFAHLRTTA